MSFGSVHNFTQIARCNFKQAKLEKVITKEAEIVQFLRNEKWGYTMEQSKKESLRGIMCCLICCPGETPEVDRYRDSIVVCYIVGKG